MKYKAVRVYFGKLHTRVTATMIRMLLLASLMTMFTPGETLSANSRGMDPSLPSADQHRLGPYHHMIRSYNEEMMNNIRKLKIDSRNSDSTSKPFDSPYFEYVSTKSVSLVQPDISVLLGEKLGSLGTEAVRKLGIKKKPRCVK